MNWLEFLYELERLAITYGLRLHMVRQPLGCGFHFWFTNVQTDKNSKTIVLLPNHDDLNDIFKRLEDEAKKFA